jgi:tetratricopeptide (TPR) repeat protein
MAMVETQIAAQSEIPSQTVYRLKYIIQRADKLGDTRILASAHHALGNLYGLTGELAQALESWNLALGLAQKMNDVILHAKLLADIADGAFELKAFKTARAASEQCLQMAQQTHQKILIARCMQHTAQLHYQNNQLSKSIRILKKAHKGAVSLKNINYWVKTLSLYALCLSHTGASGYDPAQAERIYLKLIALLSRLDMPIPRVHVLLQYATFLKSIHRFPDASRVLTDAGMVCQNLGLEKSCDRVKKEMNGLVDTHSQPWSKTSAKS